MKTPNQSNSEAATFGARFLSPADRANATHDLAARPADAVPILQALVDGSAVNHYGICYSRLGIDDCVLVTIQMLGAVADSLAPYVRSKLAGRHPYAAAALGALSSSEENIDSLVAALSCGHAELEYHAATALQDLGALEHQKVTRAKQESDHVRRVIEFAARRAK